MISFARSICFPRRGVQVTNLSLSGPPNALLEQLLRRLAEGGIVIVAAAGNEGPKAGPAYPAAYADVIAVTAVDRMKRPYRRAGRGEHIDLSAPGVDIWTAASISGARTKQARRLRCLSSLRPLR